MSAADVLHLVQGQGFDLYATPQGNLRWRARAPLPDELREQLARNKCDLLLLLADFTADELERFEERAAIAEHDGRLPRAEAERLAWQEVQAARAGPARAT